MLSVTALREKYLGDVRCRLKGSSTGPRMKEVALFLSAGSLSWNTLAFLSAGLPEHILSHSKALALGPWLEIKMQAALVELE